MLRVKIDLGEVGLQKIFLVFLRLVDLLMHIDLDVQNAGQINIA
jgi:hypothetical protein